MKGSTINWRAGGLLLFAFLCGTGRHIIESPCLVALDLEAVPGLSGFY